jgi:hypothetical protein
MQAQKYRASAFFVGKMLTELVIPIFNLAVWSKFVVRGMALSSCDAIFVLHICYFALLLSHSFHLPTTQFSIKASFIG